MSATLPSNTAVGFIVAFWLQRRLHYRYEEVLRAKCNGRRCRLMRALAVGTSLTNVDGSKLSQHATSIRCSDLWYQSNALEEKRG